jgi:ATP-dependent helicase/nuclease subunit A
MAHKKMNIEVLSASAGTGKTFTLVERLYAALTSEAVRPQAVMGTTFTVAAAQELTERVRVKLFAEGKTDLALQVRQANFGTVNSICDYLVRRYAFSAGVSPELEVLGENEQRLFFTEAAQPVLARYLEKMAPICRRFGYDNRFGGPHEWQDDVNTLVDIIRTNNLPSASIREGCKRSIATLVGMLGKPAKGSVLAFEQKLLTVLDNTVASIEAVHTEEVENVHHALAALGEARKALEGQYYTYADLHKLAGIRITSRTKAIKEKYGPLTDELQAAAGNYRSHPQLHADLEVYVSTIFEAAEECLAAYQDFKAKRGLIDFIDQEVYALKALENTAVQRDIAANLDLLLVDEFQDTSPLQLAIFLKLSALAKRSIWVGDPKQSIFGFREADPRLMAAVVKRFDSGEQKNVLSDSWRSRPALVGFFNRYFTSAFAGEHAPERVALNVKRKNAKKNEAQMTPALNVMRFKATNPVFAAKVATHVADLLNSEILIDEKDAGTLRPVKGQGVAILCRSNAECDNLASELAARGVESVVARAGLFTTAEGQFFLSALRLVIDEQDSLARAELRVLYEGKGEDLEWLKSRLDYVAALGEGFQKETWLNDDALIQKLLQLGERSVEFTASEMANAIIEAVNLRRVAASWPGAQQRLANIETLRGLAGEFEEQCVRTASPATLSAWYLWLASLKSEGLDKQAVNPSAGAVNIMTYHGSKGLEWPVVYLMSLGSDARNPFWKFHIEDNREEIDLDQVLAERTPLFFPWFMGARNLGVDWLQSAVEQLPIFPAMVKDSLDEDKRLLYVGMTRARDYLYLPLQSSKYNWIARCNVTDPASYHFLADETETTLDTSEGTIAIAHIADFDASEPVELEKEETVWFGERSGQREHPAYVINPSMMADAATGAPITVKEYGKRLALAGKPEMDAIGNALHAFFAADQSTRPLAERRAMLQHILAGHGVAANLSEDAVLEQSAAFSRWISETYKPIATYREWPLQMQVNGHFINGIADLVLETEQGLVVIDHKSYPGARETWQAKVNEFRGQLACYQQVLEAATGKRVIELAIHFVVAGAVVR